jgi:tetratricopeptide (TPR) repeat protein
MRSRSSWSSTWAWRLATCSSLAEILVEEGRWDEAEELARRALSLLGERQDHVQEIGTAQLALARALTGQGRLGEAAIWAERADATFEDASLTSHRSYAWLAQGDIESERGNDRAAADLFRRSALALLDGGGPGTAAVAATPSLDQVRVSCPRTSLSEAGEDPRNHRQRADDEESVSLVQHGRKSFRGDEEVSLT